MEHRDLKNVNNCLRQQIYHVGHTSSHLNTEVKQHWAWIILGWETLQGISGSAGTYPPPPADRVQSFQTLFVSIKWLRPAETNKQLFAYHHLLLLGDKHSSLHQLYEEKLTVFSVRFLSWTNALAYITDK